MSDIIEQIESNPIVPSAKVMSFNHMIHEVEEAWHKVYPSNYEDGQESWVCDVYETHLIAHLNGDYFEVPYSRGESDEIQISSNSEWTKVEKKTEWVTKKSLNLDDKRCLKSLGGNRLGGYLMIWGDESNKDFYDEYFSSNTKGIDSVFKQMGKLPFLYDHAADGVMKSTVFGEVDVMTPDEIGMWHEIQIKKVKQYEQLIKPYVDAKKLGCSSGALPASRKVNSKTGHIDEWVVMESTGTLRPADKRQVLDSPFSEIKSAFNEIGIDIPDHLIRDEAEIQKESESNKGIEKMRLNTSIREKMLKLKIDGLNF